VRELLEIGKSQERKKKINQTSASTAEVTDATKEASGAILSNKRVSREIQ